MWNDVFMTYLNSPNYTLYNKKSRHPFGCLLKYYFACIKVAFQGNKKMPNLEEIEHLISKNSYNGYYFETATEKKAEHT